MSRFRSSLQYAQLVRRLAEPGTDRQRQLRTHVLDEVRASGSISLLRATEVLGYRSTGNASRLLVEMAEEGLLVRLGRGVYGTDTITREGGTADGRAG